ncbi:hypothetical protein BKA70DRAFT_1438506 [Coprinopsis sp. MPI-PUGE-AT-0042]|nr:hypothetical protein BKA70DRAFT_1438506 [Coprinopsis sp. MPI-PUGE-AT-0042]
MALRQSRKRIASELLSSEEIMQRIITQATTLQLQDTRNHARPTTETAQTSLSTLQKENKENRWPPSFGFPHPSALNPPSPFIRSEHWQDAPLRHPTATSATMVDGVYSEARSTPVKAAPSLDSATRIDLQPVPNPFGTHWFTSASPQSPVVLQKTPQPADPSAVKAEFWGNPFADIRMAAFSPPAPTLAAPAQPTSVLGLGTWSCLTPRPPRSTPFNIQDSTAFVVKKVQGQTGTVVPVTPPSRPLSPSLCKPQPGRPQHELTIVSPRHDRYYNTHRKRKHKPKQIAIAAGRVERKVVSSAGTRAKMLKREAMGKLKKRGRMGMTEGAIRMLKWELGLPLKRKTSGAQG